jgi:hypothetical protein
MKKILGYITISMDVDSSTESSYSRHDPGSDTWDIHLRPAADARYPFAEGKDFKLEDVSTVLAHELGHMMAQMLKAPEHAKTDTYGTYLLPYRDQVPKEQEAWHFAEMIKPDLNQKMKNAAIEAYKNAK